MKKTIKKTRPAKLGQTNRSRAEPSLENSELRYRRLFEAAQDGILILDAQTGAITDVNPFLIDMLGYSREEFVEKKLWEVGAFRDIEASKDAFEALQKNEYIRYEDLPLKTKDGRLIQVEFVSNVYSVGDDQVIQCNIRDNTEHKRLIAAMQENERRYRTLAAQCPDGIFLIDLSGNFLTANQTMCDELGFSEDELRSMNIWDLVPEQYLDQYRTRLTRILKGESLIEPSEYTVRGKNGKLFYIDVLSAPYYNEKGIIGFQGIARDITVRKQAEQALRASEERFRSILDNIEDGYYEVDTAGNFTFFNPALVRMLGRPTNELMGMNNRLYMTPEGGNAVFQTFNRVFRTGIPEQALDWDLVRPDGTVRSVEVTVSLIKAADGSINGFRGTVHDITERKQAEEVLRESELRFRMLFDRAPLGYQSLDANGNLIDVNQAWLDLLGYTREQVVGHWFGDFLAPEYVDAFRQRFPIFKASGQIHSEFEMMHKNGSRLFIAFEGRIGYDSNSDFKQTHGILQDITERKHAELLLRESQERYQTLARISPVGIFRTDSDGSTTYVNPKWCTISGLSAEKALGDGWLDAVHPDDKAKLSRGWQAATQSQKASFSEYRFVRPDGTIAWVIGQAVPEVNIEGQTIGYVGTITDITERKRAEHQIAQRADEFAALYDTARDLATHQDLPTLLQAIVDRATTLLAAPGGGMYFYDKTRGDLYVAVSKGTLIPVGTRIQLGEGMAGRVAQTHQPLIVNNYQTWEGHSPLFEGMPVAATIEVPMILGGELIGVLLVFEIDDAARKFTEIDVRLLSLFASQAAGAIHNARLLEETIRRGQQQAALYHISTTLAQLRDRRELCQAVVSTARETLHYPFTGIFLVDPETGDRVLQAQSGWDDVPADWRLAPGVGVSEKALVTGKLQYWRDATQESVYVPGRHDTRSEVDVPIKTGGTILGVLVIEDPRVDTFDADDFAVMQALANQLAIALENARLFTETHARAEQLALLYDAGLTLNRTLEPRVQLEFLCTIATKALHADNTSFFRYDAEQNDLGFEFGVGLAQEVDVLRDLRFPLGAERGLVGWVAMKREPFNLPDVTADPRWIATDPTIRSALWVPVLHDEQLIGVLSATSMRVHAFTAQDERLFVLFANQVAVAMENARLFTGEQTRSKELVALYDLSRALADTDDFDNILSVSARHLVQSCQITFARALLVEGDEFVVRAAFPLRVLTRELEIGHHESVTALSFCQHALEQSDPIIVRATDSDLTDAEREFLFLGMARLLCLVPMRVGENQRVLWILDEARKEEREPFTAGKLRLIGSIGEQVTGALQRAKLREQTKKQLEQLESLHAIDIAISASMDLRITLNLMLEHVKTQLNIDATDVMLLNLHSQRLEYVAGIGFHTSQAQKAVIRLGEDFAGRAALERRTMRVDDPAEIEKKPHFAALCASEGFITYYGVPLIAKGQVKGVLEVYHRNSFHPESDWTSFLETIAGQAAIAIDNAQLFENLQRSNTDLELAYDETIEGWSRAMDLRDHETEGHTQRVTEITMQLARTMGIRNAELVHIRRGALLHDIGKMGVPDGILLKPGKLTDDEWLIMRKHPQLAFDMLSSTHYLRPALDIPYCHHEKWDGTGYPRGLQGEQIPLAARLFAVVDVWDALRSDRPYRPAWDEDQVLEYIRSLASTHFDPQVVKVCLESGMLGTLPE